MKVRVFTVFFLTMIIFTPYCLADMKDLLIDKKEAYTKILGESRIFDIEKALYDTSPQAKDGTNIYTLKLNVKKNLGKATFTFIREPDHQEYHTWEEYHDSYPEDKPKDHFQKVILKVSAFKGSKKSFEKQIFLEFDFIEPEEFIVHPGQTLNIKWRGDGGWGSTGYHFHSYNELLEADSKTSQAKKK